jgi:hypothetical protein
VSTLLLPDFIPKKLTLRLELLRHGYKQVSYIGERGEEIVSHGEAIDSKENDWPRANA